MKKKNSNPSRTRYNAEKRWESNKVRKLAKQKRKEERAKKKREERKNRESV